MILKCLPLGEWILSVSFVNTKHVLSPMGSYHSLLYVVENQAQPLSFCSCLFPPTPPFFHGNLFLAWKIHLPSFLWPLYVVDSHKASILPFLAILPDLFWPRLLVIHSQKYYPASHFLRANNCSKEEEQREENIYRKKEKHRWITSNITYHILLLANL